MELGALWKNKEGNGYNGRLVLDDDVVLKSDVCYDLYLNAVDKKGNYKAPAFRLYLKKSSK